MSAVPTRRPVRRSAVVLSLLAALAALAACSDDVTDTTPFEPGPIDPVTMVVRGHGPVTERFTGEVWVRGSTAYTTTWNGGGGRAIGNAIFVWDVSGATPALVDSVIVPGVSTLGDVQVADDGSLLMVATEGGPGSIVLYSLANPRKPVQVARYATPNTAPGVHTAELARVNGTLYAFLSIDPPARLVIVSLADPSAPTEVYTREMGQPFLHDVFVRGGVLFTALWNGGVTIWDIGGLGRGGRVDAPVLVGNVKTKGGAAHNVWWFHDPVTGSRRWLLVGEEGPGSTGATSSGDIHVVDVSDMSSPREVAVYSVPGAGTHNFSMDEQRGILYAAYYNAGVHALLVRGSLDTCDDDEKTADGRCDLAKMRRVAGFGLVGGDPPVYVWGVHFDQPSRSVYASDMLGGLWKLEALE